MSPPTLWQMLSAQADHVVRGAMLLEAIAAPGANAARTSAEISDIEQAGDRVTHDIILSLQRHWIVPMERDQTHRLATALDDVLDRIEDAAGVVEAVGALDGDTSLAEVTSMIREMAVGLASALVTLGPRDRIRQVLDKCQAIHVELERTRREARVAQATAIRESVSADRSLRVGFVLRALAAVADAVGDGANVLSDVALAQL